MKLLLTRKYYNDDVTFGLLTSDGDAEFSLVTMEKGRPKDGCAYLRRCLPPGEYGCKIQLELIQYKGTIVRVPWLMLDRVFQFPMARFAVDVAENPKKALIALGIAHDTFSLQPDTDYSTKMLARLAKKYYNEAKDCEAEEISLVVRDADDIVYENTSQEAIAKQLAYEEEMAQKQNAISDLFD